MLAAFVCLLLWSAPAPAPSPTPRTLTITATQFRNGKGHASFSVYRSKEDWLDQTKAVALGKAPIENGTTVFSVPNLAPGEYAVAVFHDANDNGELDMKWFPFPRPAEGSGTSNDAPASLGPPSYRDARFVFTEAGKLMRVRIVY